MLQTISKFFCLFLLLCTVISCSKPLPPDRPSVDTANLSDLQGLKYFDASKYDMSKTTNPMRAEELKETAMTIGAQGGLAYRSQRIDQVLMQDKRNLNKAFNFNGLLLPHHVLPPVLLENRRQLRLDDPQTIRLADRSYRIAEQARFVTTVPTWRDYLWMDFPPPPPPNNALLPKTPSESKIWKEAVTTGWEQGITQANNIFEENVARLKRDYEGMTLYRKLLDQNMVSLPFVATTALGVTGDGSKVMINDNIQRITALPQLDPDAKHWKPVVAQPLTSADMGS